MIRLSFSVGLIALACLLAVPALGAVIEPPVSVAALFPSIPDKPKVGISLGKILTGWLDLLDQR